MDHCSTTDKPREECGIFGVLAHEEASRIAYLGLYALQHRGQESCGMVTVDDGGFHKAVGMGKVVDFFTEPVLAELKGNIAIGHVRYSTTGDSSLLNAQPILVSCNKGEIATAHNGNIVNALTVRQELEAEGHIFQSTNDSEVISHLIARSRQTTLLEAVKDSVGRIKGAFSLLIMSHDRIFALRDPNGFRPLSLGRVGNSWAVSSETSSFDVLDGEYVRDIEPGEMVEIHKGEVISHRIAPVQRASQCVFELIYFARPNSIVFGESVYDFRELLGRTLAREHPVEADVVISVPDSGTVAAIGYAEEAGLPFSMGLIRSHYIGRTFIEPTQRIRDFGVLIKFAPVASKIKGKRVVIVDDSLVRGTTSRKLVSLIRKAGARELHLRISAPPTRFPCFYGIDFPDPAELIANKMNVPEIADALGVDSLGYISLEGMYAAMSQAGTAERYCAACFDGKYPVEVEDDTAKDKCTRGFRIHGA
jgi:amidophosphoribosyltransferase